MQTSFSDAQRKNPAIAELDGVLRNCVHCGMCTATCPTFVLLGDELDSPRGRIYLTQKMLEKNTAPTAAVVKHIDRCLSCLSCMTTCPSGVNYMRLIDQARLHIETTFMRPFADRVLRGFLAFILTRPRFFRLGLVLGRGARPLAKIAPQNEPQWWQRMRAMLSMVPEKLDPSVKPGVFPATGTRRARVALLRGCAQSVLAPHITATSIELLNRLGVEVVLADGASCCGALPLHMGKQAQARILARATILAWHTEIATNGLDAIIIDTSGCGTTIKDYAHLFPPGDELHEAASAVAMRALDISEYVQKIGFEPKLDIGAMRIAYHPACSLQHGQGVREAPIALLRQAGFDVSVPRDAHLCCGSAGTYNLLQPEIAEKLRAKKLTSLEVLAPQAIAAGNLGCLKQLGSGAIPAVHTIELLNWAAGGDKPLRLA
jgi:glycolate oxidase iron-sulfur subunit